jgi:hypothetical protein
MSDHKVLLEFIVDILFIALFQVLDKLLEHFTEEVELDFVNSS